MVKNLPANEGNARDEGSNSWVGEIPWSRKWQPSPVFLPGEFHGQRSLGATVHGVAELDTTEHHHHIHLKLTQHCKINYISIKML